MKKGIFYCDIYGTYVDHFSSVSSSDVRENNVRQFVKSLEELANSENLDELYFCFVSSSSIEEINGCLNEIKPFIEKSSKLKIAKSITTDVTVDTKYICGDTVKSKACQVLDNLAQKKDIKRFYYADDTLIFHDILNFFMSQKNMNFEKTSFVVKNDCNASSKSDGVNIIGLTSIIKEYINKLNNEENSALQSI